LTGRVLLLLPTTSYKAEDFLQAAERLDVEVVVGTDRAQALERQAPGNTVALDFAHPEDALRTILDLAAATPLRGVIGVDDETTVLAAMAQQALDLPHNSIEATRASADKHETRRRMARAGLRTPRFRLVDTDVSPDTVAGELDYPVVIKPRSLSASRGVMRADDPDGFVRAFHRVRTILHRAATEGRPVDTGHVLVEDFLPGEEVALEGLIDGGELRPLALFDKPDPLDGPLFEETLYVTPSRHPVAVQGAVVEEVGRACRALGLCEGPVHAELRLCRGEPWLLEVAARTIGGLCSRTLRFGTGISLEELILRHHLRLPTADLRREQLAAGVLMIPVPRAGVLRAVHGLAAARSSPNVEELTLSVHVGATLEPLPEGHRYVGFLFARAETPERVERALREAHAHLRFDVDPA